MVSGLGAPGANSLGSQSNIDIERTVPVPSAGSSALQCSRYSVKEVFAKFGSSGTVK